MEDLADTSRTQEWLAQFSLRDRALAKELVGAILTVSADKLVNELHTKLDQRLNSGDGPAAFYVERELPSGSVLFHQPASPPQRACGPGPSPTNPNNEEVGSEGIIANILTQLHREHKHKNMIFNHASPDDFRDNKIRRFIVITDFIGSGQQITSYLDAVWGTRSIQSWRSYGLLKFEVITFSATPIGERRVRAHKCRPDIHTIITCPTLDSAFPRKMRAMMRDLCVRYNPGKWGRENGALGFQNIAALIAFSHGAPNNCPRILTSQAPNWIPLFPKRRTTTTRNAFANDTIAHAQRTLERMGQKAISESIWLRDQETQSLAVKRLLVMTALVRGPRNDHAISVKTKLPLIDVQNAITTAREFGWITDRRTLTDEGRAEIHHIRTPVRADTWELPPEDKPWYFPQRLRGPR